MDGNERKLQIIDLSVTIVLFVVACFAGKIVMNSYGTWLAFNMPAIGIVAIGELLWLKVFRKKLVEKNDT